MIFKIFTEVSVRSGFFHRLDQFFPLYKLAVLDLRLDLFYIAFVSFSRIRFASFFPVHIAAGCLPALRFIFFR